MKKIIKGDNKVEINNEKIFNAISLLNTKIDSIATTINTNSDNRLSNESIAVITAAAYSIFGKRVSIRSVKLIK